MNRASQLKSKNAKGQSSSSAGIWLVGGAILVLALVVLVLVLSQRSGVTPVAAPDVDTGWVDGKSMGDPAAPVTIQMWEDFLCPACQQWTSQVKPTLFEEYVKTGKVRLEFRQFPLQQHAPGAQMAAQASECAADQNQFWPFHDRIFQMASQRGQDGVTYDALMGYASEVGLDTAQMKSCVDNLTHQANVADSVTQAQQMGLSSTPSILVNGQLIENPFNYNLLKAAIDAQLEPAS